MSTGLSNVRWSMPSESHRTLPAWQAIGAVAFASAVVAGYALDLTRIWHPAGTLGYGTNGDGVVYAVTKGSAADVAGIRVGDEIDVAATPPQFRFDAATPMGSFVRAPGEVETIAVVRNGVRHMLTLRTTLQSDVGTLGYDAWHVFEFAVAVLFAFVGTALVLLRPSAMTLGFYLYMLWVSPGNPTIAVLSFPFPAIWFAYTFYSVFNVVGSVGLAAFAIRFLSEPLTGWRTIADRLLPWYFATWLAVGLAGQFKAGGPGGQLLSVTYTAMNLAVTCAALAIFVATYVRTHGAERQRIRWVVAGFGLYLTSQFVTSLVATYYAYLVPWWLTHVSEVVSILLPITFAYAVIKYRVIDVSFVVSRTLVYGMLTTVLVGAFSLIDWFFAGYLRLARLGTVAEIVAAIGIGFWFNSLHRQIDRLIDATFFHQRHRAESQLARNASALPFATTLKAVALALVDEPVRSLVLASAALFRRKDGAFAREHDVGWGHGDIDRLDDADDHLVSLVQAEAGPLALHEHAWRDSGVPAGPARPVLVLPIFVRREIVALVFYGSHQHGEALDPDEIKAIAGLANGAAAAYDHIESAALRDRVAALERIIAEMKVQPA